MAARTRAKKLSRAELREHALAAASAVGVPAACDVVVAGGGASGLVAAIVAAEAGARTCVLEQDLECGRKILATGNGRCNFANEDLDPARYRNGACLSPRLAGARWLEEVLGFFAASQAWPGPRRRAEVDPLSRQATSVRNVLLARARRAGVTLAPARKVTSGGTLWPAAGRSPSRRTRQEGRPAGRRHYRQGRRDGRRRRLRARPRAGPIDRGRGARALRPGVRAREQWP